MHFVDPRTGRIVQRVATNKPTYRVVNVEEVALIEDTVVEVVPLATELVIEEAVVLPEKFVKIRKKKNRSSESL